MTEAYDTRELIAALECRDDDDKLTINDLSNDVLVSIFTALGNLGWVRRTVPCVCKAWNELYCSEDASPLHETLEVDFVEAVGSAAAREGALSRPVGGLSATTRIVPEEWALRHAVHASTVISWAEKRAGWVRKLHLMG